MVWYNTGLASRNLMSLGFELAFGGGTRFGILDGSSGSPVQRDYIDDPQLMSRDSGQHVVIKNLFRMFGALEKNVSENSLQREWF